MFVLYQAFIFKIMDPYLLEMFMDSAIPGIEEVVHLAALVVENDSEISSIIYRKVEKNNPIQNPKITAKKTFKLSMLWLDKWINCNNRKYYERFGMRKAPTQELIKYLSTRIKQQSEVPKYIQFSTDKKIHVFLHLLRTGLSFRNFVSKFGLSISTSLWHNFPSYICSIFSSLKDHLIKFPDFEKQTLIKQQIYKEYKFPNCIGFIDTCTFYVNKCQLSVEAVCDHNLVFHYFKIIKGNPKPSFIDSQLGQALTGLVSRENHLLGSSQYPLLLNLLTPFEDSANQTSYNNAHFKAWSNVKQAFVTLKRTFKRLIALRVTLNEPSDVLHAACFLHNFIRQSLIEEVLDRNCDDGLQISAEVNPFDKRQFISETIELNYS